MSDIQKRKQAHIDLCLLPESQVGSELFSQYELPYRALPELRLEDVSVENELLGKKLKQPLIIASMTGGVAHAKQINTNLAIAAESCGVAMGVGSQRIALEVEDARTTFELVRKHAPTTVIFANMGAVQLNYGRSFDDYQRVVDMLRADALYLHLNPLQEALQPEGDTDFRNLLDKIAELVKKVSVPLFVKEVGHGIDVQTAQALIDRGVKGIDCAGVGGTSWAWVEARRAENLFYQEWFKDFGYRSDTLIEQYQELTGDVYKVVSGGVRTPIEVVKAGALGAHMYSMAQPFLKPALESPEAVSEMIQLWERAVRTILFGCGCASWREVTQLSLDKEAPER